MFRKTCRPIVAAVAVVVLALWSRTAAQTPAPVDPTAQFFNDSVVTDVYFAMNGKDWNTLKTNYLDNTYYPVDFKWNGITVRNSGIRSRGTGSRSGAKPGLRLDFDRYKSDQKFLGLKSLVLRNSTQDPSNMHERLSMLFFKRMGLSAPREIYARLYVNNVYSGLYAVVESIDKSFVAATFGNDAGYIYKFDYEPTDAPYYLTYRSSSAADYVPKPFKPETNESDPRGDVVERWVWTVNNATDANFPAAVSEFVDIPALIRHVAAEAYVADNDGFIGNWGMNNFYMYRLPDSHRFNLISWDKSEAFKDGPGYPIWHNHLDVAEAQRNRLWTRLMNYPEYKNYFLDVLMECIAVANEIPADAAAGDMRGWLAREIERHYALITPAVLQDTNRPYSTDQYNAAVDALRVFAAERPANIAAQVAASR